MLMQGLFIAIGLLTVMVAPETTVFVAILWALFAIK